MEIMKWEKDETVAILTMTNGENRQNLVFSDTLNKMLDEIIADKTITALVITSNDEKNFSQGIDVVWILDKAQKKDYQPVIDFIRGMDVVFKKLVTYPVPVIAAINGHAYGNGSILSCACDFRFMRADKGFFCFPEVNLGIPFRPGMNAFIKKAVPMYKLAEMQLTGNRYTAKELETHHVILKACEDQADLMAQALAFAKTFKKKRGIFGELKRRLHKDIVEILEAPDEFVSGGAFSLTIDD
ncbi:MAG TPA: enoyl-CoA hydratase/isomerase family protein [Smithellaceae bacterium]|nr:enoyl-CoA hydratase/isomerase family protein [Smithellaceae bacterium]HRS89758.1 enoyl-CoA hydratase/isomerase family protein [Smithellaceae bacterium]HRV26615.1 enoyl-CoA hydratase/isomerase family protein [Smithellaceae bacterium]